MDCLPANSESIGRSGSKASLASLLAAPTARAVADDVFPERLAELDAGLSSLRVRVASLEAAAAAAAGGSSPGAQPLPAGGRPLVGVAAAGGATPLARTRVALFGAGDAAGGDAADGAGTPASGAVGVAFGALSDAGAVQELMQLGPAEQGAFLDRLLATVQKQCVRLRGQYADGSELASQLAAVEANVANLQAALGTNGAAAIAAQPTSPGGGGASLLRTDALQSVMEQIAALRSIGSQTHPAIQELLQSHDARISALQKQLKTLSHDVVAAVSEQATASALAAMRNLAKSDDDSDGLAGSADMHENLKRQGKAVVSLRNKLTILQARDVQHASPGDLLLLLPIARSSSCGPTPACVRPIFPCRHLHVSRR